MEATPNANSGLVSALQPEHIVKYATKLKGYSPDDINKVINWAADYGDYDLERAEYLAKVQCSGKELYIPCKPNYSGAQKLTWKTCPGIAVSVLTVPLMNKAIAEQSPNKVSDIDLYRYEDYACSK